MSVAMPRLLLSGPDLSGPHLSEPQLSETRSERTFIASINRNSVSATLIRTPLSAMIWEPHLSQYSSNDYQVVVAVPIWWERYQSSQDGGILLIHRSNRVISSMTTLPWVDEHVLSMVYSSAQHVLQSKRWSSTMWLSDMRDRFT